MKLKIQSVALINYSKCFVALMKELEKKKWMIETKNSYMKIKYVWDYYASEPSVNIIAHERAEYKLEYLIFYFVFSVYSSQQQ